MNDCWKNLPTVLVNYIRLLAKRKPYPYIDELKAFHHYQVIFEKTDDLEDFILLHQLSFCEYWSVKIGCLMKISSLITLIIEIIDHFNHCPLYLYCDIRYNLVN